MCSHRSYAFQGYDGLPGYPGPPGYKGVKVSKHDTFIQCYYIIDGLGKVL